jgi:hypothetical protein
MYSRSASNTKLEKTVMSGNSKYFSELADYILNLGAYKATKFIDEKTTLKATLKRFDRKMPRKNSSRVEVLFTLGKPNYEERKFLRLCKISGEPFPVKKAQLKYPRIKQ